MKAVVFKGPREVAVEEVENPKIKKPTDVIVKLTSSAICGTDLHRYDGETPAEPGSVLGHEPMGVVEEVGTWCSVNKTRRQGSYNSKYSLWIMFKLHSRINQ